MKIRELMKKDIFLGIIIHACLLGLALSLGYNSYKELVKEFEPLTNTVRDSIKATFPWAILIFSGIYVIFSSIKKGRFFLTIWQYLFSIAIYTVLLNLFFFSKGRDVFIPLNLSILYFVTLLTLLFGCRDLRKISISNAKYLFREQDYLPPIVYRFLMKNMPMVQSFVKDKPSVPFIIAFTTLLIISAFLLAFKVDNVAEDLAKISYFSLVIGVGIEVYQMIKYGENNSRNDEQ